MASGKMTVYFLWMYEMNGFLDTTTTSTTTASCIINRNPCQ